MKYYLVATTSCVLVGIEKCRVFIVPRVLEAAFEKEYAGRVLMVSKNREALPALPLRLYE